MVDVVTGDIIYSGSGGWAIIGADATLKSWTVMPETGHTITTYDGVESQAIHDTGGGGLWQTGGIGGVVMGPDGKLWVTGENFVGGGGGLFVEYPRHDDVSDATGTPMAVDSDYYILQPAGFLHDRTRRCYWVLGPRGDAFSFFKISESGELVAKYELQFQGSDISISRMETTSCQMSPDGTRFLFLGYVDPNFPSLLGADLDSLVADTVNECVQVVTADQMQSGIGMGMTDADGDLCVGIDSRGYYWVGQQSNGGIAILDDQLNLVESRDANTQWDAWPHCATSWMFIDNVGYCLSSSGGVTALRKFTPESLSDLYAAPEWFGSEQVYNSPVNLWWAATGGGLLSTAFTAPTPNIAASLGSKLTRFVRA